MVPSNAKIVKCPYCGTEKELMCLASGNTFGAEFWSDNKRIAPMLPQISPIQKCQRCGKYYQEYLLKSREGNDCSFEKGELSYQEWKEAYGQFSEEKIPESNLNNVRFWLIQAYNDHYHRNNNEKTSMRHGRQNNGPIPTPTQEEYDFISGIIKEFIEIYDWSKVEKPSLLKADLYRQANEMQKCKETLSDIAAQQMEEFEMIIYNDIKERMEKGDNKVFKLNI